MISEIEYLYYYYYYSIGGDNRYEILFGEDTVAKIDKGKDEVDKNQQPDKNIKTEGLANDKIEKSSELRMLKNYADYIHPEEKCLSDTRFPKFPKGFKNEGNPKTFIK